MSAALSIALAALVALSDAAPPAPVASRMKIEIQGDLALVDVDSSISLEGSPEERVLDLALPAGAAVPGWQIDGERLPPASDTAREEHAAALAALEVNATRAVLEEGTDFRLHLAAPGRRRAHVRYRYTAPLGCRRGRFFLSVPGSLEPEPLPAEVTVVAPGLSLRELQIAGAQARPGVPRKVPARAAWELSFALGQGQGPAQLLAAEVAGTRTLALGLCTAEPRTAHPPPERVLVLLDRSRSVGPAGIVLERDLTRALIEALPPSVKFNVLVFDRVSTPLFSLPRAATREALAAVDDEAGPGSLHNGTDLPHALHTAAEMARTLGPARTAIAVVTDGALPEEQTGGALLAAAGFSAADTRLAVLVVRPPGDEPGAPGALAALRALPAHFGGVMRTVDATDLRAAAGEAVAALGRGGDLFALALTVPGQRSAEVLGFVPRDGGAPQTVRWTAPLPTTATVRHDGRTLAVGLHAALVPSSWSAGARRGWRASGARLASWVEPGPAPSRTSDDEITRGQMDRLVVRNALSLAFMPRARACYLGRKVRTPADFELRGRVRLELTLERGEMVGAAVRSSTLRRPDLEACLRDAAFGLEVPRPLHRDAPVVAALNLLFQPSTPSATAPAASPMDREIDLIIGPVTPTDPLDLLDVLGSGSTKDAPPPREK